jgi:hypothetical protein
VYDTIIEETQEETGGGANGQSAVIVDHLGPGL